GYVWYVVRVQPRGEGVAGGGDAGDGEVGVWVVAGESGDDPRAVRENDFNLAGPVHDVAVRQNEPVRREDEPGAAATRLPGKPRIGLAALHPMQRVNIDDRRADLLRRADDRLRVGVQQVV